MRNQWMGAVFVLGLASADIAGQARMTSTDPAVLLQAAMHTEQVEGRISEAIDAYKQVVAQAGANTDVAAQALLRLGAAYEKLGRPEAREAYERVVRNYPDHPNVSAAARARLSRAGGAPRVPSTVSTRQLHEGFWSRPMDVSADGRWAVGSERKGYSSHDIVLHDLTTGRATVLAAGSRGRFGYQARISADGRQVTYNWFENDQTSEVRVIAVGAAGAIPRSFRAAPGVSMHPLDWSADGTRVLVMLRRDESAGPQPTSVEIAWLSPQTGAIRPLRQVAEGWIVDAQVSPDGRHIAFTAASRPGSTDRYLYIVDTDTGQDTGVVASAGARYRPFWTPDGAHVLYIDSLTGGITGLWAVPVTDGHITGEPVQVQHGLQGTPIGVTADGTVLYVRVAGRRGNGVYLVDRRPAASDRVTVLEGLGVSWSRDGRLLAMLRRGSNTGRGEMVLVVRDVTTGEERSYHGSGLAFYTPQWLPANAGVIVVASAHAGGKAVHAFHRVDLSTGTFTRLFDRDTATHTRTNNGVLSPDGKTLYLGRSEGERQPVRDLVAVDVASGVERHVASLSGASGGAVAGLALSPDGQTLAVTTWTREYETASLSTVALDGAGVRTVVDSFATGWLADDLRWSPEGQSLVFTAFDARSNWRLMRVAATGGTPEPDGLDHDTLAPLLEEVRMFPGNFNNFDLSPDGTRVAASTLTWASAQVWALENLLATLAQR